jgi:phosphoglycolate phosphatase
VSEASAIRAVLFDIDGTLLITGGAGGIAWQRAFEQLHGVEADIAEHTDAGMTDPEIAAIIFRQVIGREGTQAERSKAIGSYLEHLPEAVAKSAGYRVMPGIEELLPRLIEAGVLLGLVTGNIEAAAHIKLARSQLNRFFSFGGYGSDSADRTELTEAALGRGALVSGGALSRFRRTEASKRGRETKIFESWLRHQSLEISGAKLMLERITSKLRVL